jgi:glycosyltransferase involved in cell wall biosynthesis
MKVYQLVFQLNSGDAIGNDIMALKNVIESLEYETGIFVYDINTECGKKNALLYTQMPALDDYDIVIYHSGFLPLGQFFGKLNCRKMLVFHNITPPEYFRNYDLDLCNILNQCLKELKYLADKVDYCLADSEFNKKDLERHGYKCKIDVLPILIPMNEYLTTMPSNEILKKYAEKHPNILFAGRFAPNKKIENIIAVFYNYRRYIDKDARLFLVGSYSFTNKYYRSLKQYVEDLNIINNVIFTGHIPFNEILAYYVLSDIYLCLSEHEGFCVPLVEAMIFDKPIVAYDAAAIKETLGGSGFLLSDNDPLLVAMVIDRIVTDKILQKNIISGQRTRLEYFRYEDIKRMFINYLHNFIEGKDEKFY